MENQNAKTTTSLIITFLNVKGSVDRSNANQHNDNSQITKIIENPIYQNFIYLPS